MLFVWEDTFVYPAPLLRSIFLSVSLLIPFGETRFLLFIQPFRIFSVPQAWNTLMVIFNLFNVRLIALRKSLFAFDASELKGMDPHDMLASAK